MAQWVKVLAAKPDNLSSIPGPTWWKEGTPDSRKASSDFHLDTGTHACTVYHKLKNKI